VAITTVNATAGTTTTRALNYDATGRLTGVSSSDGLSVTVGYNARGLRASLAVSDAHPDSGGAASFTERLTYRGDRLGQITVQEGTASFTETFLYRQDGEPLELLYQQQGQGVPSRYYYAVDGRGDVTALTNAQGQVVDAYAYDLWGAPQPGPGGFGALGYVVEGVPQPLRYRGYFYDAWYDGAGLWSNGEYVSKGDRPLPWYWLGVRSYDPTLERFLQPDPSALDGARSYAYCHDAPADCADPSGLVSQNTGPEPPLPTVPGTGEGASGAKAGSVSPVTEVTGVGESLSTQQTAIYGTLERIRGLISDRANASPDVVGRYTYQMEGLQTRLNEAASALDDPELRLLVAEEFSAIGGEAGAIESQILADYPVQVVSEPAFITENRIPLDNETILSDSNRFTRTNRRVKGATVYRDIEGRFYHRDTLHTGAAAQIEYYDAEGSHLGVLNPITGDVIGGPVAGRTVGG